MTNKILTAIMIGLILLLGTNAGASDLQKGVLQYKWSDSASKYNGLSKLGDKEAISYYSKPGEIYTIGDISVEKVIYGFYKDQLFGVYLNINSIEVYDKLFLHMKTQYGLPAYKTASDDLFVYKWKQQDVTIKLKMNTSTRKMKLAFYYRPLSCKLKDKHREELDTTSFHFVPIEKDKKPEKLILFKF